MNQGVCISLDADRSCGVKALKVVVMLILAYNPSGWSLFQFEAGQERYSIGHLDIFLLCYGP
jgi:hypothetical protein